MRVLLIEDEEHKANELIAVIEKNGVKREHITVVGGVRQAVLAVSDEEFGLIVLDMALPTFSRDSNPEGIGGEPQAVGGVEVLRALKSTGRRARVIVVTQYPEITVSGHRVKINSIAKFVSERYQQNVLGAVMYSYKSAEWEGSFNKLMGSKK